MKWIVRYKIITYLILEISINLIFNIWSVLNAEENLENKIFKIYSYVDNKEDSIYETVSVWSSVLYWDKLLTNAHVILDPDWVPYWNYEICETTNFKEEPICNNIWILEYYNSDKDLALLSLYNKNSLVENQKNTLKLSKKDLKIWDKVWVYGYPNNWWNTITYTEWKISGFNLGLYKIDANLDYWNSWWGAFDDKWDLIWIPTIINTWATVLWYMIWAKDIQDFLEKQWEIIELDTLEKEDIIKKEEFNKYILNLQNIINLNNINSKSFSLNNIKEYGFNVVWWAYSYDKRNISRFDIISKTKKTYIIISSVHNIWQDINSWSFTQKLDKSIKLSNKKDFSKTYSKDIKINNKNITINLYIWLKKNFNKKDNTKFIMLELVNDNISYKIIWDLNHANEIKKAIDLFKKEFIIKETYKNNESWIIEYSKNFTLDLNSKDVIYTNWIWEYYYIEHYITTTLSSWELITWKLIINTLNNADLTSNTLEWFLKYYTDNKSEYKIIKNINSVNIGIIKTVENNYAQYYLYIFDKKENITLYSFDFRFDLDLANANEYEELISNIIDSINLENQEIPFINWIR